MTMGTSATNIEGFLKNHIESYGPMRKKGSILYTFFRSPLCILTTIYIQGYPRRRRNLNLTVTAGFAEAEELDGLGFPEDW